MPAEPETKDILKRAPLPAALPRREIRYEPECGGAMMRISEEVRERLNYTPPYRQEQMFARAVVSISRSTPGEWLILCGRSRWWPRCARRCRAAALHADETPRAGVKAQTAVYGLHGMVRSPHR